MAAVGVIEAYLADRSEANRTAVVEHYTATIGRIADRMMRRMPPSAMVQRDDLFSAGLVALWECVEKYDPAKGTKFTTYFGTRCMGAMRDYVRQVDFVPRTARERQRAGGAVAEMVSLDAILDGVHSGAEGSCHYDPCVDDDQVDMPASCDEVRSLMRYLDSRQRRIARYLLLEGRTLGEVAARLRTTTAEVSRCRAEILDRLRARVPVPDTLRVHQPC